MSQNPSKRAAASNTILSRSATSTRIDAPLRNVLHHSERSTRKAPALRTRLKSNGLLCSDFLAKLLSTMLALLLMGGLLSGCVFIRGLTGDDRQQPDQLASGYNDELFVDPEDWQSIVVDSQFKFGERIDEGPLAGGRQYLLALGDYPHLDGSTVCMPMAVEFARQHNGLDLDNATAFSSFSTTPYAYEGLISGERVSLSGWFEGVSDDEREDNYVYFRDSPLDLFLGTEPSDAEIAAARSEGLELVKEPICYDAFVFITRADNPVESLTLEQVRGIYTGNYTNWSELGGNDEAIVAYQRSENSGSQTGMENLVMQGEPMMSAPEVTIVNTMSGLVDYVAEYQNDANAIGYTYKFYIDKLYNDPNIKTIAIDGAAPTTDNIRSGEYPLSTNYYAVYAVKTVQAPEDDAKTSTSSTGNGSGGTDAAADGSGSTGSASSTGSRSTGSASSTGSSTSASNTSSSASASSTGSSAGAVSAKQASVEKAKRFVEWITSDEGQRCVQQAGYIPIHEV